MAIGLRFKFENGRQEQYEALNERMGIAEDPPEGLICHTAGPIEGGWGVIDFWESRERFDSFRQGRLEPTIEAMGDAALPGPPDIKEFPVHNIITP